MAMALGNSLVKLERVTEFLPSRHVLWVVKDNLCLEHSHADGHEEKLLAHAEQRKQSVCPVWKKSVISLDFSEKV